MNGLSPGSAPWWAATQQASDLAAACAGASNTHLLKLMRNSTSAPSKLNCLEQRNVHPQGEKICTSFALDLGHFLSSAWEFPQDLALVLVAATVRWAWEAPTLHQELQHKMQASAWWVLQDSTMRILRDRSYH